MNVWIMFILTIVLVESITEILTKSELFSPLREFFFNRRDRSKICKWFNNLLECGYCTSVWVSWFVVFMWYLKPENVLVYIFFGGLILHRFANMLHFLIDRLNSNRTRDLDL